MVKMGTVKTDELSAEEYHDGLLASVKAQVKAIMEESVTKKFVHEESEHVLRLCANIHKCLVEHMRKRTAGFLRTNKIRNLFSKVGKSMPEVAQLVVKIEEAELAISGLSQDGKSMNGMRSLSQQQQQRQRKQIWVRLALTEKKLDKIVEFLVDNCSKFYEKHSIISDPVRGRILSSLLVGPCALEYTKMKTSDHYWSDPPADELLQRHKLHCRNEAHTLGRRPTLTSTSRYSTSEVSEKNLNFSGAGNAFREYVESLHQNSKSTLLYGKNNVVVQPREELKPIHGYLSLHQVLDSLFVKWTPNQLMNVNEQKKSVNCNHDNETTEKGSPEGEGIRPSLVPNGSVKSSALIPGTFFRRDQAADKPKKPVSYWEYAISVNVQDVVYLHCHQRNDVGGTLVLVGQDGVQRPPVCFPPGGHLLAFLTCLETGLLPHGHLDPPLWSQRGKGKVFPRLHKRSSHSSSSSAGSQSEAEEATDFVFRVTSGSSNAINRDSAVEADPIPENFDAYSIGPNYSCYTGQNPKGCSSRSSLKVLCDTMRRQIISRAFYGWLAHCRHLSTVRTHLSALVLPDQCQLPEEDVQPINQEIWDSLLVDEKVSDKRKLMQHVYFGGIEHPMRVVIWPYLLGHYPMDATIADRTRIDEETLHDYERVLKEWRAVEKIIKKKEAESLAAKLSSDSRTSSTSSLDCLPKHSLYVSPLRKQSTLSDVFASFDQDSNPQTSQAPEKAADVFENEKTVVHEKQNSGVQHTHKKGHVLREKFKADFKGESRSHNDHTPYSSISTETSTTDRRFSNVTAASTSLDTGPASVDEESRLDHILEAEQEGDNVSARQSSTSDSDSKSSARKTPSLIKQDGIDMANSMDRDMTREDLADGELAEDQVNTPEDSFMLNFTSEVLDNFSLNLHRIQKDVDRCDRNHEYFTNTCNLGKLRNIMCSYVWMNLDTGYMQGMCDLCAPLLLVMDDEPKVYSCFTQLMKRMGSNFPNGGAMDAHFANMRSLIQVLDAELFEHMQSKGDFTHFYFCYRWFLLDFKRELSYDNDVFTVWETIWAARHVCSEHFVLFFALALLHNYRDIVLDNEMDFTDIIKFFNEMAEKHNASKILKRAEAFVYEVQSMISK